MVRAGRERARRRSVGLAVAGAGVIAVGAGVLWPGMLSHRNTAYADSNGGVIPIPSADASAAGSYWASRLSTTASATAPKASGSAAAMLNAASGAAESDRQRDRFELAERRRNGAFSAAAGAPMAVSSPLVRRRVQRRVAGGAMFSTSDGSISGQGHYCTGSVVDSPEGDIVVTAAHCVTTPRASTRTSPSCPATTTARTRTACGSRPPWSSRRSGPRAAIRTTTWPSWWCTRRAREARSRTWSAATSSA